MCINTNKKETFESSNRDVQLINSFTASLKHLYAKDLRTPKFSSQDASMCLCFVCSRCVGESLERNLTLL